MAYFVAAVSPDERMITQMAELRPTLHQTRRTKSSIVRRGRSRHAPRVKSGKSTGRLFISTDFSVSGDTALEVTES